MTAVPYAARSYSGGAIATTIPTGIGSIDTSFTVALATNWPSGSGGNFYVDVDRGLPTEEKILCSSTSSLVITVASGGRGADGTSAVAHSPGCTVQVVHVAQDDSEANQVVNQVLGQPSAAKGDILAMLSAAGPNTLTRIPIGSANQILQVGASALPQWSSTLLQPVTSALGNGATASGSFANLATISSSVTLTTSTKALVIFSGTLQQSAAGDVVELGVAVSGASTIAASSSFCISFDAPANGAFGTSSMTIPFGTGGGGPGALTAGSNTFTLQSAVVVGGTGTITNALLTVIPLN